MASFLEGQLRNALAKGFKGKLLVGTLSRATSTTNDVYGDPIEGTPVTFRVEGFCDAYNDVYRNQAGIPETDSKVTLILGNCQTEPIKDDLISFPNWPQFKVRKVKIDPVRATAECQSFEA